MKRVFLILGASSELGVALIRRLLLNNLDEDEIEFILHYYNSKESLVKLGEEYAGVCMHLLQADFSDLEETKRFINSIRENKKNPTDIISFPACSYRFNRLSELDEERMQKDMNIQVFSFAMICQAFIPNMAEKKYGKIIAMLSSATKGIPPKNTSEYTTVKYALLGLIKSLASDYGELGININAVSPGMIETKFIQGIGRKVKELTAEKNPRHRNLCVDDVIPAILFLLSENNQFMNGTNMNLTGFPE